MNKTTRPPDLLLSLYEMMVRLRTFEERVAKLYKAGEMPGFIHLYPGEEAVAAGVCAHLGFEDVVTSTHRGHGHALAKGCPPRAVMAELYGRRDGCSGGRGGSMHMYDRARGLLGTNGIVGGGVAPAAGAALAFRNLKQPHVAVSFFGDGASNMGIVYETLNLAAIYRLPVVFVCENNLYATATPLRLIAANTEIATRAAAFHLPGAAVDGNDVLAVYDAAGAAIARARAGGGPTLIEAKTYRTHGHHEGDPVTGTYRTRAEVEDWKNNRCPLRNFRRRLLAEFGRTEAEAVAIEQRVEAEIEQAVEFARNDPWPDPATAARHLFVEAQP